VDGVKALRLKEKSFFIESLFLFYFFTVSQVPSGIRIVAFAINRIQSLILYHWIGSPLFQSFPVEADEVGTCPKDAEGKTRLIQVSSCRHWSFANHKQSNLWDMVGFPGSYLRTDGVRA
jgi:hypothetical protein